MSQISNNSCLSASTHVANDPLTLLLLLLKKKNSGNVVTEASVLCLVGNSSLEILFGNERMIYIKVVTLTHLPIEMEQ